MQSSKNSAFFTVLIMGKHFGQRILNSEDHTSLCLRYTIRSSDASKAICYKIYLFYFLKVFPSSSHYEGIHLMTPSQKINSCSTIANDRGRENSVFCHSLYPDFQHCVEWVPAVKTHALSFLSACSWKQICSSTLLQPENIQQLLHSVKVGCQLSCFAASPWASPVCSLGFRCASPSPSITQEKRMSNPL